MAGESTGAGEFLILSPSVGSSVAVRERHLRVWHHIGIRAWQPKGWFGTGWLKSVAGAERTWLTPSWSDTPAPAILPAMRRPPLNR